MCLSDPLYGFIVGSDGIVAIYGVESRRSPQAEGVQYLIAGAEGGDGDNMTPGRTQPLERDTLDLKKGVTDLRCSTVKRFSNIESIQNTSIIQNSAHSPNFPVAMASSICVEAGLVENYFTTAPIFSKLRQYPAIASIFILCPKLQALKTKCAIHGMHMADMGFLWLMVILSLGYRQPPPTSSLPMGVHRGEWQVPGNMGSQKKYTRNWRNMLAGFYCDLPHRAGYELQNTCDIYWDLYWDGIN